MNKALNILLIALAIVKLGQAEDTPSAAPREPTFKIVFVRDLISYLRYYPREQLTPFSYDKKEGFTLGKKWDNKLFDLEYELVGFRNDDFIKTEKYSYPGDVTVDIQHIQLLFKNEITRPRNVFLIGGGIGQRSVSLLVEVPETKDETLTCYVKVTGDVYDVIN